MLEVKDLTVRYRERTAVDHVSFRVEAGEWLMLVGPNGAGKTTLLSALSQCASYGGMILLHGKNARDWKARDYARHVGVLSQAHQVDYAFTVEEVVRLGRYAYRRGFFSGEDAQGDACVEEALMQTGLLPRRSQSVLALSGGELQRVFLAQVLAQQPELLLLDEPANHLDLAYQQQLFTLIGEWLRHGSRAVICVAHDLSLAMRFGTRALLLCEGQAAALGNPETALTRERLSAVYGMDVYAWMRDMLACWA